MPQSERSANIRALLEWIAEAGSGGRSAAGCLAWVIEEQTDFGATEKTAKAYLETLRGRMMVQTKDPNKPIITVSPKGKKWLERHQI